MSNTAQQPDCPRCRVLEQRVAELEAQVAHLTRLLEAVQRAGKRQAAPFRKRKNPNPKKPGRKPGDDYGQQAFRAAPTPEQITETHEAPLPAECPECQSTRLRETHVDLQFQVEIPVEPIYRQFNIHVGCCQDCGTRIQGRHELQTSDALGAARSQMGPRLHTFMAILNKKFGLSHGKIQSLLQDFFRIRLARSQSCRSMLRTARRIGHTRQSIVRSIRGSPQVVPDETGWRVGGKNAWMHVFVGTQATCYVIDPRRDDGPGKRILGQNYSGILVHDGWSVYDKFGSCGHQTCLAHLIRRCREMIESMAPTASRASLVLPRGVLKLLTDALALRDRKAVLTRVGYLRKFDQLLVRLMILVRRRYRDAASERLAKHLFKHRDQLFTFLLEEGVDATNWRAEQAIRPAVVNRKVWGGNRTWVGADAQCTLMSILATAVQRGLSAVDYFIASLTSPKPLPLLAPPGR